MHSARNPFTLDVFGLPADPIVAADLALAAALTAAGVGHMLLTPFYYRRESPINQAWFAGSGLALSAIGMLNLVRVRGDDATARALSKVANPAAAIFLSVVAARLREPQTFAGLALSLGLTAMAMRRREAQQ